MAVQEDLVMEFDVIGAICTEPETIRKVAPILRPEDFTSAACAEVYRYALEADHNRKCFDVYIAADALHGKIADERAFLARCVDTCATTANIEAHAKWIRKRADDARLTAAVMEILSTPRAHTDMAADIAAVCAAQIQARPRRRMRKLNELAGKAYDRQFLPDKSRVKTGVQSLDGLLGGMRGGELVLIGARPSVGKSAFALALAESAARNGKAAVIYSLEMSGVEIGERAIVQYTPSVTMDDLANRRICGEDKEAMEKARAVADAFNRMEIPVYVSDEPNMTVSRIRSDLLVMENVGIVIVDYLGLMKPERKYQTRDLEMGALSRGLKLLALELKIPVVALAQLNRGVDDTKEPSLKDLRDSGNLEQDADKVIFLWNECAFQEQQIVGVSVRKNRNGKIGKISLRFDGKHMRFHTPPPDYRPPDSEEQKKTKNGAGSGRGGFY